ncbi:SRPBCC family protein [Devosia nitrariae]|uniref:Activator of HSP90 ATPase n=1 Tax=Devosia nitrariae TaxID=2071872 RepID=A0ABQ5W6P7_9HYPH|nr:SRPBCC domain-containing protein [Devosia nitrariae]GLQ55466.1 activator of HSP90 ATPase [Devosia nitrariae]
MTGNDKGGGPYEITIVHIFDAPRELVFRNWVDAVDVRTWFAPDNCTVSFCEVDAQPGGKWRVEYSYDFGGDYIEYGEFYEVVEPERLTFSLTQEDGDGNVGHKTLITVSFSEAGAKTEMTFNQKGFETPARRDNNTEGWNECFRKLDEHMANAGAA